MNENYASKKDLVIASGIISCFILAAAGFCALCLIPMEYCREMMIISIAVVLLQFSISNMFFDIFKITVKYEKLGKFVDSFLLGFLVLLLAFDVSCFVLKVNGVIKFKTFNSNVFWHGNTSLFYRVMIPQNQFKVLVFI